jgi:hypothetical protein
VAEARTAFSTGTTCGGQQAFASGIGTDGDTVSSGADNGGYEADELQDTWSEPVTQALLNQIQQKIQTPGTGKAPAGTNTGNQARMKRALAQKETQVPTQTRILALAWAQTNSTGNGTTTGTDAGDSTETKSRLTAELAEHRRRHWHSRALLML